MAEQTPAPSGADLARQALSRARAAAKTAPAPKTRGPKRIRRERGTGRDPQPLAGILGNLAADEGWADSLGGGNILDRWPELCPTAFTATTRPTGYDPNTGTLTVRADSHTIAAGLRMMERQLAGHINQKLGRTVVRHVRIGVGGDQHTPVDVPGVPQRPDPQAPVRTRETASPGYRATLEAALAHKPERQPTDPYTLEAIARQETALRTNRQPEHEHRDAVWAQDDAETAAGPAPGSVEESLRRARAYARQQRAGHEPRRAFDAA